MSATHLAEAIDLLERSNADLEPERLAADDARMLLQAYARAQRLAAFGVATLTRKVEDPSTVARATGTSITSARSTVETGKVLGSAEHLNVAFRNGDVSLEQATAIARAEESAPGSAPALVRVAKEEPFHVLREKARKVTLEAESHRALSTRQREARSARSYSDDLGMVHVHLALEPHVGTPLVARAEAEAQRLSRETRRDGANEPFERYLAEA